MYEKRVVAIYYLYTDAHGYIHPPSPKYKTPSSDIAQQGGGGGAFFNNVVYLLLYFFPLLCDEGKYIQSSSFDRMAGP